ncbi:MAG: tetratricopeptide repeat protein [bacterium]
MVKSVLIFALLFWLGGCGGDPQQAKADRFAEGTDLVEAFEFDRAAKEFDEIGEIDAGDPGPALGRAMIFEAQRQYLEALNLYMVVGSARPSDVRAQAGQYRMFMRLESYSEALKAAGAMTTLEPTDPVLRAGLARTMIASGQYSRARDAVRGAVKDGLHEGTGDLIIARSFWLEQKPDSAAFYRERAASTTAMSSDYSLALAEWYESIGLIDSSIHASELSVVPANSDPFVVDEHFFRALRHGYGSVARRVVQRYAVKPEAETVKLMLSYLYHIFVGNRTAAMTTRGSVVQALGETYSSLYYGLFISSDIAATISIRDDVAAIRRGIRAEQWDEECIEFVDYLLAARLVGIMEEKESTRALEGVKPPHSNDKEIRAGRAWMYKKTGLEEQADLQVKQMIEYHSTQADWLTAAAELVSRHAFREYALADSLYRRSLDLDTLYRAAFEGIVAMYNRLGEPARAMKVFDDYPRFAELYPELAIEAAKQMVEVGRTKEAMDLFASSYPLVAGAHEAVARFIDQLQLRDKQAQQTQVLEVLQQVAADNTDILILAADLASDLGKYSDGLALAEKALQIEPDLMEAGVEQARAKYFLGRKEEALAQLAANYAIDRPNHSNCFWYSRLLALEETDLDNAMNIARGSLFDAGGDVYTHCNLSFVYYQSGRFDLAVGEARKAGKRHPNHPLPFFRLGLALYMQDDPEAATQLRKAIDLGLSGDKLKEARAILDKL